MTPLLALACVLVALPVSATHARSEDSQRIATSPPATPPSKDNHSQKKMPASAFLKLIRSGICPDAKGVELFKTAGDKRRGKC